MRTTPPGSRILLTLIIAAALTGCTRQPAPGPSAPPGRVGASATATTAPAPAPEPAPVARAGRGEVVVTLFHETHMHGSLLGKDYQGHPADGRTFAHYMAVVERQRQRLKAGASLSLGNGDDLSNELEVPAVLGGGGGAAIPTEGRHAVEAFNAARMDANTFGFNELLEFPGGTGRLRELVSQSRFRWVSANVRDGKRPGEVLGYGEGARRFAIKQVGGLRLGVTGVVSPDFELGDGGMAARVAPEVAVLDPVKALREVVPQMRAAGAQVVVVVVLSHLEFEQMEAIAKQVDGVNAILGSHGPVGAGGFLDEPRVVGETILSVPGHDMAAVGQLDLIVRRSDGHVVRHAFHRHLLTPAGPTSVAVKAVLDRYLAQR